MENSEIRDCVDNLYSHLDELSFVTDKDTLLKLSTDFISEFMAFQGKLIENLQKPQSETESDNVDDNGINNAECEQPAEENNEATVIVDLEEETNNEAAVIVDLEEETNNEATVIVDSEEAVNTDDTNNCATEDVQTAASEVDDETPKFAVFYSKNNASYISINEHNRCVLERNMAKAFYVLADANGIANGQNTLSRYDIDKFKPITIKFLTQKEFDNTIGRALSMKALMENMSVETSDVIDSTHKVTNFAKNTNNGSGSNHIGSKPKADYSYGSDYDYGSYGYRGGYGCHGYDSSGSRDSGYDFFRSPAYGVQKKNDTRPTEEKTPAYKSTVPLRTRMESPFSLYKSLHTGLDDEDVMLPSSMYRDVPTITNDVVDLLNVNDIDTVIKLINDTLSNINHTKSGWLTQYVHVPSITYDYLMDFDYSKLDEAIDEWNQSFDVMPDTTVIYSEDFDPTVKGFIDNVKNARMKYYNGEDLDEWVSYAVYNFVRCIIAYDNYMYSNAYFSQ